MSDANRYLTPILRLRDHLKQAEDVHGLLLLSEICTSMNEYHTDLYARLAAGQAIGKAKHDTWNKAGC